MGEVAKIEKVEAPAVSETTAIVSMIERAARDPAVDIDKMERLLVMQERVIARQARASYDAALAEMQQELPIIERRGEITIREKDAAGKRTGDIQQSTSYALWEDINEAIKPVLTKHGFALSFRTGLADDGRIKVTGILSHRDGHREETTMTLQHDSSGSKNAVQAVGSSTSYGKRYTAAALLNLTSRGEDDDGAKGGEPESITEAQADELKKLLERTGGDITKFCEFSKIEKLDDLPATRFEAAKVLINRTARQRAAQKVKA